MHTHRLIMTRAPLSNSNVHALGGERYMLWRLLPIDTVRHCAIFWTGGVQYLDLAFTNTRRTAIRYIEKRNPRQWVPSSWTHNLTVRKVIIWLSSVASDTLLSINFVRIEWQPIVSFNVRGRILVCRWALSAVNNTRRWMMVSGVDHPSMPCWLKKRTLPEDSACWTKYVNWHV